MGCCSEERPQIRVGHPVPLFTAEAFEKGDFKKVSLSDYKGKWTLLFFYPLDFTFVCPTELIELSKRSKELTDMGVSIISVSVDSVYSHQAWCKDIGELNFPMVSDMDKNISYDYEVLHDDGMSLRGAFIIDPDQKLRASMVYDLPLGRNVDEIKRVFEAAMSGELCPVGWHKGDKSLGKA
jgi:alkyl hydroperoxide reductase subunit AhpC